MSSTKAAPLIRATTRSARRAFAPTRPTFSAPASHFSSSSTFKYPTEPVIPTSSTSYPSTSRSSSASTSTPQPSGSRLYAPPSTQAVQHVNNLLRPIGCELDPLTAERVCLHKSAVVKGRFIPQNERSTGHNEKLAFIGRRVLRMHFSIFLSKALAENPTALHRHLSQTALDEILDTKELGGNLGRAWRLEQAMKWREVRGPTGEMTGLYKSRGCTAEALVGAVYTQCGIAASSKLFHSLVLPNLSLPHSLASALDEAGPQEITSPQPSLRRAVA